MLAARRTLAVFETAEPKRRPRLAGADATSVPVDVHALQTRVAEAFAPPVEKRYPALIRLCLFVAAPSALWIGLLALGRAALRVL